MRKIEDFLEPGETISSSKEITDEHGLVDYDIHTVQREGLRDGDEVVLDIGFLSEELVLIGGNPLELQLLGGRGQIIEVNLGTGEKNITNLGVRGKTLHNISPENTLYWYGNPYRGRDNPRRTASHGLVRRKR